MPTRFRRYDPDQGLLLSPDLRDWLPDGNPVLMPCAARLRHIAGTQWGTRKS